MPPAQRIVVGVDGSPGSRAALQWAVDECVLRGRPLLIVHSAQPDDLADVLSPSEVTIRLADDEASRLLNTCSAYASDRQPAVPVSSLMSHAHAADALVDLSAGSDLVVVGTRGHNALTASMLGSVSTTVSAHAHCPVAVVPDGHVLSAYTGAPRVVVGLSPGRLAQPVLEFAVEEAARRGATVTVLQASRHTDVDVNGRPARIVRPRVEPDLSNHIDRLRNSNPQLKIDVRSASGEPADALLQLGHGAQLLVIGCHHSDDRWSTRLGPVASSVLHRAPCPVVVVGSLNRLQRQPTRWPQTLALHAFFL